MSQHTFEPLHQAPWNWHMRLVRFPWSITNLPDVVLHLRQHPQSVSVMKKSALGEASRSLRWSMLLKKFSALASPTNSSVRFEDYVITLQSSADSTSLVTRKEVLDRLTSPSLILCVEQCVESRKLLDALHESFMASIPSLWHENGDGMLFIQLQELKRKFERRLPEFNLDGRLKVQLNKLKTLLCSIPACCPITNKTT